MRVRNTATARDKSCDVIVTWSVLESIYDVCNALQKYGYNVM